MSMLWSFMVLMLMEPILGFVMDIITTFKSVIKTYIDNFLNRQKSKLTETS